VLAIVSTRKNQTLGLHQALQLHDFYFTIEEAVEQPVDSSRAKSTDPASGKAEYRVRLKVENRALRRPFKFSGERSSGSSEQGADAGPSSACDKVGRLVEGDFSRR